MEKFRIKSPTIALFKDDGRQVAYKVPEGATVTVKGELNEDKVVEVICDEKTVLMFTEDIRARGERLD
jgi:phosphoribosyl-ATP pyrophosphohydrolase